MTDATPSGRGKDDLTAQVLEGRYRVERVLGRGGMGTVYLAHDGRMDRQVVVKVPHARFLEEEGFRERFEREIRSLTRLPHPHIVKAYDVGSLARPGGLEPLPYAILECLAGGSLKDRLVAGGGKQAPAEVAQWLLPVAQALDFIHGENVVHRDVKPGNVLFDTKGNVFLADFGIAKALGAIDTGLTQTGATPGSPDYMAPEAAMGSTVGPAYDQYALAVVVYEALSGGLPHKADTPVAILVKKQTEPPPPLSATAPNVSAGAASAVMRALEWDPAKRFPTCVSFADAFAEGLRSSAAAGESLSRETTSRAPPSMVTNQESARPRRPRGPIVLAALVLVAGGALAVYFLGHDSPSPGTGASGSGPAPEAAELVLVVDEPANGAVLGSRDVRVKGRVTGPADALVRVNGKDATRTWDHFETVIRAPDDGVLAIRVKALSPGHADKDEARSVEVDTLAPVIEVADPATAESTLPYAQASAVIKGRVSDRHLQEIRVGGNGVRRHDDFFDTAVDVPEGATTTVEIVAIDAAGNRATATRKITREKAPPPAAPFAAELSDATSKGLDGDWDAAKAAWARSRAKGAKDADAPKALLDGIARYDAPPVLEVTEPAEGATVRESPLHVRGALSSGRATDEVFVNGASVRRGPGAFDAVVALSREGRGEIVVAVADRGTARADIRRAIDYEKQTEPWRAFLSDWAAPEGSEVDSVTGYPKKIRRKKDSMVMVLIPAGTFQMGAVPGDGEASANERPSHTVTLARAYYLDEHEVTNEEFQAFVTTKAYRTSVEESGKGYAMAADGASFAQASGVTWRLPIAGARPSAAWEQLPVVLVSWLDAAQYAMWAGVGTEDDPGLPTEAEFERALRGGFEGRKYGWGSDMPPTSPVGNLPDDALRRAYPKFVGNAPVGHWKPLEGYDDGYAGTAPVKSFAPNPYGLYDMDGNVSEWCADLWDDSDYSRVAPQNPPRGWHATRGSAWLEDPRALRASARGGAPAGVGTATLGFRLSKRLPGQTKPEPVPSKASPATPVGGFLEGWAEPMGAEIDAATGYPKRIKRTKDSMVMVLIPEGTFQMGAVPGDNEASDNEKPRHSVTLSKAYYMDEHEVTNEEFEAFTTATGHKTTAEVTGKGTIQDGDGHFKQTIGASWRATLPGGKRPSDWARHPVVLVTWDDAKAFADWAGTTLPTEAQFERAMRAGHEGRKYPWGDELPAPSGTGNYRDEAFKRGIKVAMGGMEGYDDGFERTAPVKSFRPNEYGLYDMSGNVFEWCADWLGKDYYKKSPERDPLGPASGTSSPASGPSHVLRGGAWNMSPDALRASYRGDVGSLTGRFDFDGFRCAKSLP